MSSESTDSVAQGLKEFFNSKSIVKDYATADRATGPPARAMLHQAGLSSESLRADVKYDSETAVISQEKESTLDDVQDEVKTVVNSLRSSEGGVRRENAQRIAQQMLAEWGVSSADTTANKSGSTGSSGKNGKCVGELERLFSDI